VGSGFDLPWSITSGVFLKDNEIAQAVAGQLGQVGVRVRVTPTERAKLQTDVTKGAFEGLTSVAWGTQSDPDPMLAYLYAPDRGLHDPAIFSSVEQARKTVDDAERAQIYRALSQKTYDDAIWLFVHAQDELYAKRKNVEWTPFFTTASKTYVYFFNVPM
jgi:peptide/nickel transport system substrate-binding protein